MKNPIYEIINSIQIVLIIISLGLILAIAIELLK